MTSPLTTCAGQDCARQPVCARSAVEPLFGDFEVTRLCYSGYSFYRPIPPAVADVEQPEKESLCPCS